MGGRLPFLSEAEAPFPFASMNCIAFVLLVVISFTVHLSAEDLFVS